MITTLAEILPHAARKHAKRTALIIEDRRFSFHELELLSNRIANSLVAIGVSPGDRVTLFGSNCWEWLVSYYGIAKTGAVVIPINIMLTPEEVRYAVTDSGSCAFFLRLPVRPSLRTGAWNPRQLAWRAGVLTSSLPPPPSSGDCR